MKSTSSSQIYSRTYLNNLKNHCKVIRPINSKRSKDQKKWHLNARTDLVSKDWLCLQSDQLFLIISGLIIRWAKWNGTVLKLQCSKKAFPSYLQHEVMRDSLFTTHSLLWYFPPRNDTVNNNKCAVNTLQTQATHIHWVRWPNVFLFCYCHICLFIAIYRIKNKNSKLQK